MEFEYDTKNILYVRIDRKRKFLGSIFLRALGMKSNEDILRTFYQVERISLRDRRSVLERFARACRSQADARNQAIRSSEEVLVGAHKRITENLCTRNWSRPSDLAGATSALADLEGAVQRRRRRESPDRRSACSKPTSR